MEQQGYIHFNGSIFNAGEPVLTSSNRGFRYGDALFESIRLMNGEILYLEKHLARLERGMKYLGMAEHPDLNFHNLYLIIRHLDQVNQLRGNGRIRLQVFRNDGGFYRPLHNEISYLVEAEPLALTRYTLNEKGLRMDLFPEVRKPHEPLSGLKTSSALTYVLAQLYRKKNFLDDCFLLNASGRVAEAISSNVFVVHGGLLKTPPASEGGVQGVMREVLLDMCRDVLSLPVKESPLTSDDLLAADEIFLTDVINGIRWVGAFRQKRYYHTLSRQLLTELVSLEAGKHSA
jgi:branched-subunit amino acid aminotransferase/4-amino-4-deoxychorismate lyase